MKAIILAAGENDISRQINGGTPKCLLKVGGKTLLERQLSVFKDLGFEEKNITVVIGGKGETWTEENQNLVKSIHDNVLINNENIEKNQSFSLWLAIKDVTEDVLCLDGDLLFDKEVIDKVTTSKHPSLLLTSFGKGFKTGRRVLVKKDRVLGIGPKIISDLIYSGIAKFSKDFLSPLKEELKSGEHDNTTIDVPIYKICINNFIFQINLEDGAEQTFLHGGSYAITKEAALSEAIDSSGIKKIVRKEATEDKEKLINEIKWMVDLPDDAKEHFPKILRYDVDSDPVYIEMVKYPMKTLRMLLLDGDIKAEQALEALDGLFDFMFDKIYSRSVKTPSKEMISNTYFKRIEDRLVESKAKAKIFEKIIDAETITINGKKFQNMPQILEKLKNNKELIKTLNVPTVSLVHGDLHIDNVLVDKNQLSNFILIDPRGKMYKGATEGDYAYDLGKIWHSLNGLYDLLHEGKFNLKISMKNENIDADFKLMQHDSLNEFRKVFSNVPALLYKHEKIRSDPSWDVRTRFNEAVHFCSMVPFHICGEKEEKHAVAMYLRGVMLLDKFLEEFDFSSSEPTLINVNTPQDYLKAKRVFRKET